MVVRLLILLLLSRALLAPWITLVSFLAVLCNVCIIQVGTPRPWVKKSIESVKRSAGALVVDDLGSSAQARSRFTGNNAETCHGSTCCGRNLGIGSMHLAGMRRKQLGLSLGCVFQYVWHGRLTFSKRQEIPYQQQGPSLFNANDPLRHA